jgi:2-deoxy-D-gluconate 3-dehydrogenase
MNIISLFNLEGKTALITGGNKGIGRAMTLALAEAGADVICVSSSIALQGSKIEQAIKDLGRGFKAYQCDFANRNRLKDFIKEVKNDFGGIDILINNAGIIQRKPALEHSDEYWDSVLAINLDAPFILAREFAKEMIVKGKGKIIFTASLLSFQGGINVPSYAASKGAIASLVKSLANEWASKGLNVNAIAPGYIATDNTALLREDATRNKAILDRIPAGRWGEAEDLKGATVFLASSASDYINGTILTIDGGWMGR